MTDRLYDARRIWNTLVNYAGATDVDGNWVSFRQWFDKAVEKGGDEYRFMGSLGFGGKFWVSRELGFYVSCYPEDKTPDRVAVIDDTNRRLSTIWREALGA